MSVDKFGRHESSFAREVLRGPPGVGFKLTHDGHYDLKRKRLCNLADPIENEGAVNLKMLRVLTLNCESSNDNFDAKNKRIQNVASAEKDTDAVNRRYITQEISKLKQDIYDQIDKLSTTLKNIRPNHERTVDIGNSLYNKRNESGEALHLLNSNELRR